MNKIDNFSPEDGVWLKLDELLIELQETNQIERGIENLFKVFERFPDEDGSGVFWTILHSIESTKNYELELLKSIERHPTEMTINMIQRITNTGIRKINDIKVSDILLDVLNHKNSNSDVIEDVKELIDEI